MYSVERTLTQEEQEIVFRLRCLTGDTKEVYVDELSLDSSHISASGTMYKLQEVPGYPTEVWVDGLEITSTSDLIVLGYKYLKFTSPILSVGTSLLVIYEHFRNSDKEIIDTYDTAAMTYLTKQCGLSMEELGIDLLVLATAYVLLMRDINTYITSAVRLRDSDSEFDGTNRVGLLRDILNNISK